MSRQKRLSMQGIRVLGAFVNTSDEELCGSELMTRLAVQSGTLYPLLLQFEKRGLLTSRWETQRAADLGRPRRRMYRVTAQGSELFRAAVVDLGLNVAVSWA